MATRNKKGQQQFPRETPPEAPLQISKREICEREINAAIELLAADGDPVAIHVLAMAALHVIEGIAKTRNAETPLSRSASAVPEHLRKSFHDIFNAAFNFMKHGGEADALVPDFYPSSHWLTLVVASQTFSEVMGGNVAGIRKLSEWVRREKGAEVPILADALEKSVVSSGGVDGG